MTKFEILGRLEEIRTSGGGVDEMRGKDRHGKFIIWSFSWYKLNSLSKDDIISFLAEKSLTYTLVEIRRIIPYIYRHSLIFKESSDYQTNLDADVIEAIANSIWMYENEMKWGKDHYPFKK